MKCDYDHVIFLNCLWIRFIQCIWYKIRFLDLPQMYWNRISEGGTWSSVYTHRGTQTAFLRWSEVWSSLSLEGAAAADASQETAHESRRHFAELVPSRILHCEFICFILFTLREIISFLFIILSAITDRLPWKYGSFCLCDFRTKVSWVFHFCIKFSDFNVLWFQLMGWA